MQTDIRLEQESPWRERLNLLALIFGLAVGGAILYKLAGPPRLPEHIPSVAELLVFLNGDEVPLAALAYIFTMAAWLVWIWLVGSIALRVLVDVSETIARGAVWVAALRSFSDRVTLPIVRHVVDGAIVAVVVVNLVARTSMTASAAPLTQETTQAVVEVRPSETTEQKTAAEPQKTKRFVDYKVMAGDTLWTISERFYGTGEEFPRLVDANAGRAMPDGEEFTRQGVIQPGWVLRVPLPSQTLLEEDGQVVYVVERGDTLWGISARFLGNPMRWPEVFDLNRGSARLPNGWTLTNPNLIWPGLRLRLPLPLEDIPVPPPAPDPLTLVPPPISERPVRPAPPVARSAPTVAPVAPTAAAATAVPTPIPTAAPVETSQADLPPFVAWGALGAGAVAATGAAVMLRRRTRRSLDEPPIPSNEPALPKADFAEAEFTRILSHRLQGGEAEPAIIVAGQVLHFLKDNSIEDARIVTAKQGRTSITLAIHAGLLTEQRILALAPQLGTHVGGTVVASLNADHDVLLQVSGLKMSMLLAPTAPLPDLPLLLPLGVTTRRDGVYAGWPELGHVLVAGLPGTGPDIVLTSLVSALTARCRPEDVSLWTIAGHRTLPQQLATLPHQREGFVDPGDAAAVRRVLDDLQRELTERIASAKGNGGAQTPACQKPGRVLVIGELADLKDYEMELETLAAHGAAHSIHIVAATSRPEELTVDNLSGFSTRIILQLLDDDQSIRLLGQPAAAEVSHGELLVRIEGRLPMRLRGLRVSSEHLDQMVRLMQTAYTQRPPGPPDNGDSPLPGEPSPKAVIDGGDVPPDVPAAPAAMNGHSAQAEQPSVAAIAPAPPVSNGAVHVEPALNGHVVDVKPNGHNGTASVARMEMPELPDGVELLGTNAAVHVQCFGTFQVRAGDHIITSVKDEGAAYKPWEMLVFMAVQPDGQVSRDRLIASLWPESDMELGANNMRVVMSRVRRMLRKYVPDLTTEALGCDRDTVCRLDASQVVSDVQQFVAVVKASRRLPTVQAIAALRYALALYQGDLLSDANTPFYSWADDREDRGLSLQEYYQEEHKRAIQRLAQLLLDNRQAREAIPLLKSLLKAEPTLETVVRDLYRCYQQTGDLGSLIREDAALRQALRAIYKDVRDAALDGRHWEPEADTIALYAAIRAELESRPSTSDRPATPDTAR
ncbi:MAG: LysM peptidoglycan-binding domain-containing protein [Anaerolineae bacterium]